MAVLLFEARFHAPILAGTKRQTIRAPRKRPVRPGELLLLRGWSGAPYRSAQVALREATCTAVGPIAVNPGRGRLVEVAGRAVPPDRLDDFARADGFADAADFEGHWSAKLPWWDSFEGILIRWEVIP